MNLDYFKYCKELLIELEKTYYSSDNYKIYELIPSLIPVVAITYYCLTEDIIITRDDKNPDVDTRFTLNMPKGLIDVLFENEDLITVSRKITNSHLWLLSGIRNSIMHGASVIDIKNHKLLIDNDSFKNNLECEIDLNWFINYLYYADINHNYVTKEFSFAFTEIIDQIDNSKKLNDLSSEYIYANLLHFFKIEVKAKEGIEDLKPRDSIIRIIMEFAYDYIETFNNSLKFMDNKYSLINCFKRGIKRKEEETEDEYIARLFKHYFKKHLQVHLEEKLPEYEFKIYAVRPKNEFEDLLDEEKIADILRHKKLKTQMRFASSWITNELMEDLINPFEEEDFFRQFIDIFKRIEAWKQPEYITPSDMKLLLSNNYEDVEKGESNVYKRIKGYNAIAKKTYDKVILRMILMQDFKGPDLAIAMNLSRELHNNFDYVNYENEEALQYAKKKCPYIFEKYTAILKKENGMCDQDLVTLHKQPFNEINELNQLLNDSKNEFIKMVIYLAGINCYVLNKENTFDAESELYETAIDDTFEAYSKTVYDHEYRLVKQSLDKINAKLEKQNNMRFSDKTPKHVITKHQEETNNLLELKQEAEEELSRFEVKEIDGTNMVKVDKKNASTLIRNSISHPERIEILDNSIIRLNDYDNKGVLTGVVYVPLSNLIHFFLNDVFDKKLSEGK